MKATLEFNLDEEEDQLRFDLANKADRMQTTIEEIQQDIFRPARKHGYNNKKINELLDKCGEDENGYNYGAELIGELEDIFTQILNDNQITDVF